jgi:hypothetical protein
MANHLEALISQYREWKGWLVRKNIRVGKRTRGGYEGELDVVAYDPASNKVIHYEPSVDAHDWAKREKRYKLKFDLGKKHIPLEVFPWLKPDFQLEQIAVFYLVSEKRKTFLDGRAMSIDELVKMIRDEVVKEGQASKKAIPEQYDLLRTIQLVKCGYVKPL